MNIPCATYRLQFNAAFRFTDAGRILEYLRDLGVTDVYASPLLTARKGSVHGYDVTDPTGINPEIGTRKEFEDFAARLRDSHLGLVVDIVPNHMAASLENPWWVDMLAKGQASPYANFFDIDWSSGKLILPILGKPYGECLEAGEFSIQDGQLRYLGLTLPLQMEEDDARADLDAIISRQAYRLAYWRKAADEINYRRFFDISDLAGLRTERDDVFETTHSLVLELVQRGIVMGLRIDHIDGLRDPKSYLDRLPPVYVVVEKILGSAESVPADWKCNGTTGYDFLNIVNGPFIDPSGYQALDRIYREFTKTNTPLVEVFHARKRQVMKELFGCEVRTLSDRLTALAHPHRHARDLSREEIREALVSVTAALPVYRTYIRDFSISVTDRNYIEAALETDRNEATDFLRQVLLLEPPPYLMEQRNDYLDFVMLWQQFTGPVMAKGLEDTAFYVHNPLMSINEVGGDCQAPDAYFTVEAFHRRVLSRQTSSMNASTTHDTKRSEDVRARIDVISEMPEEWERCLSRWRRLNPGDSAPDANEQVLIYQTLLGAWPISRERLHEYLIKALREGKTHTSWLNADTAYEAQVLAFVDQLMDPKRSGKFFEDFLRFQQKLAYFGALNSLSQTLLKITAPGVPDFYQGTELWDYSLADPDNRRPVDFATRIELLEWTKHHGPPKDLMSHWQDGRIKLFTVWKTLNFRRMNRDLFLRGEYVPLNLTGKHAAHVIAFMRRLRDRAVLVAVPRLTSKITRPEKPANWGDTAVVLPPGAPTHWNNVFTGKPVPSPGSVASLFAEFPIALAESSP